MHECVNETFLLNLKKKDQGLLWLKFFMILIKTAGQLMNKISDYKLYEIRFLRCVFLYLCARI